MRLLVCGGRDYALQAQCWPFLDALLDVHGVEELCHGGAAGADELARLWAHARSVKNVEYPANWKRDGRAAGPIRNKWMLDDFGPDLVVAFAGGKGTGHMVQTARAVGVEVIEVPLGRRFNAVILEEP